MKIKHLTLVFLLLCTHALMAQVKIGDRSETIDPASLLELESADKVLVITRVTTAEMGSISPLSGALVYNTDEACLFYHNGQTWINLCEALGITFTNEPIVNQDTTIIITEFEDRFNFEVGQIRGENIVDFSIGSQEIQNNAINAEKLAPNSVGTEEIEDNAVTTAEIDLVDVTLSDFVNDVPYLVQADLTAVTVLYDGTVSGLAATNVQDAIDQLILGADFPFNTDLDVIGEELVVTDFGGTQSVPLADINNQDIATDNTPGNISLTNGGSVLTLNVEDADNDPLNEIQTITSVDGTVLITPNGTDFDLSAPASDGSETVINGGPDIEVTGSGTAADPYLVSNTFTELDDDPLNEIQAITSTDGSVEITPTGNDFDLSITPANGSETVITQGVNIDVAGSGTAGDPYVISNTFTELDADPENEIQTISSTDGSVQITAAGNNFDLSVAAIPVGTLGAVLFSDGASGLQQNPGQLFWDTANNRLGIGTNNPQNKLHVTGQTRSAGFASSGGTANEPAYSFYTGTDSNTGMFRAAADQLGFSTGGVEAMRIDAGQNVGIGTDLPLARLHVAGAAIFEGNITVATINGVPFPDYVFQQYFEGVSKLNPDYRRLTLEEVYDFVKKYGHLPGIPSAAEMQENGVTIDLAVLHNLEKIEELFLHTIEQEEKIKAQQKENHDLKMQVMDLKKRLQVIEELLLERKSN